MSLVRSLFAGWLCGLMLCTSTDARTHERLTPVLVGDSWSIADNPDLGEYTSENQEPVDFAVWQAADGTWQLWSCIRATKCGGQTRLFHRWEGDSITTTDWEPKGIAMEASVELGETRGGMQAPHVVKQNGLYYMFYGSYENIALAVSKDGKHFAKQIQPHGGTALFGEGAGNGARDAMLLKVSSQWNCYYTAHDSERGKVLCRTSNDLRNWGHSMVVSGGGRFGWHATSHECPHVVEPVVGEYRLFVTQIYGKGSRSAVFASNNPLDFGVNDDTHYLTTLPIAAPEFVEVDGQHYVAHLKEGLDGILVTKVDWKMMEQPALLDFNDPEHRKKWTIESGDIEVTFTNADRQDHAPWTDYFIATDKLKNGASDKSRKGVILSPAFKLWERNCVMLASGSWITNVFIVDAETGDELAKFSGRNSDQLRTIPINTKELGIRGKNVRIKLVDHGHDSVNFGGIFTDIVSPKRDGTD